MWYKFYAGFVTKNEVREWSQPGLLGFWGLNPILPNPASQFAMSFNLPWPTMSLIHALNPLPAIIYLAIVNQEIDWRTLWVWVFARKEQDDSEEKLGTHDETGWNMTEPIEDVFWSCMLILLTRSKQQQPANLFCDCPSCSHNKQQELLSVFRGLHSSNYQLQLLRCLLPVHLPLQQQLSMSERNSITTGQHVTNFQANIKV